ncbi:hypothetical protein EYR41_002354 [Orbilia oligospora]|uniref:Uncharacterized protein n=1 Tax=Orbilia oligospora TaxID=2813651 RepID=A0A8H2DIG8_ORBOL|nr:hypothetical protein EYR41_002354 [Orbilia oligospora]
MVRTQFLGHERHGYGLLADSERIDIFVVPTPTMTNSFVNIRRRTQPSSNFDMKRSRAGEVQSQKPSPSDSCSSSHQSMLPHRPNDHFESEIILKAPSKRRFYSEIISTLTKLLTIFSKIMTREVQVVEK